MKGYIKRGLLIFFCIFLIRDIKANAQEISLNISKQTIFVNQKIILKVTPKEMKSKIKWISGNKKLAIVSKIGIVTGKKSGKVKITAVSKVDNTKKAVCWVTVKNFKEKTIPCKKTDIEMGSNILQNIYGKEMSYKLFTSHKQVQDFIKQVNRKYDHNCSEREIVKKLGRYKKSYFQNKVLCIMVTGSVSGSQKLKLGSLKRTQGASGRIIGKLRVEYSKQPEDAMWNGDAVAHHIFLEINKKDVNMIQTFKIEKVK